MTLREVVRPFRGGALALLAATALAACGDTAPEARAAAPLPAEGAAARLASAESPVMTIYKTPTCGCCTKWVDHVKEHGFQVEVHDMDDVAPIKAQHGLPGEFASCHTALVGGYVVEGHVPADVIARLLAERPEVAGLAVPGMPMGSPGMEGPYKDEYAIIAFTRDGGASVYETR